MVAVAALPVIEIPHVPEAPVPVNVGDMNIISCCQSIGYGAALPVIEMPLPEAPVPVNVGI